MSKQAGPALIHVPHLFSVVEPGVYRCASPTAAQVGAPSLPVHAEAYIKVPFLAQLNLKTIISLTPEHPIKPLLAFTKANNVDFVRCPLFAGLPELTSRCTSG